MIKSLSGKPVAEETILLRLGETLPNGNHYVVTQQFRRLIRELALRPIYIQYGAPLRTPIDTTESFQEKIKTMDVLKVCGKIENLRLLEDRQQPNKAVVIGTVAPAGPYSVHLRDLIQGTGTPARYRARVFGRVEKDISNSTITYVEKIVGWDLVLL